MMFERFTDRARQVVHTALAEAERLDQRPVATGHLLLGVLADQNSLSVRVLGDAGAAAEQLRARVVRQITQDAAILGPDDAAALREIGIDLAEVVARVEQSLGAGTLSGPAPAPARRRFGRWRGNGSFSPEAKKTLELALREAIRLRHRHIGTEHILLGLLREERGTAARVLTAAGLNLADLRQQVETALRVAA